MLSKSLQVAGLKEVYVVVGYQGEQLQKHLGAKYAGIHICYVHAEDWSKGNLYSFLAAQVFSEDDFILCMCDHIFDSQIVEKLMNMNPHSVLTLAVDRVQQSSSSSRPKESRNLTKSFS